MKIWASTTIEKIWGTTEPLVRTPMFELHRLHIWPGMRCSLHVHQFKHNCFYVISGELFIDSVNGEFAPAGTIKLLPGRVQTVRPGVHHQFHTELSGCVALEMYYTEPLSEDIVRRNIGGAYHG